jgi:hypothetical protein
MIGIEMNMIIRHEYNHALLDTCRRQDLSKEYLYTVAIKQRAELAAAQRTIEAQAATINQAREIISSTYNEDASDDRAEKWLATL